MSRYWLKRENKCSKNISCGKCSKWDKCLKLFVKETHDLVDTGVKDIHFSNEHQRYEKNLVPDKAFKDLRKCKKRISCRSCNGYLKCKGVGTHPLGC